MNRDNQQLQTIRCFDAITLRVPACWRCGPSQEVEGSWCCCEESEETGTLWITLDRFAPRESADELDPERVVDNLIANLSRDSAPPLQEAREEVDGGYLWMRIFDFTEDGEPLRGFRYKFFLFQRSEVVVVDFHFVLTGSALDVPATRDLITIVDREIRAARIAPFADATDTRDADPFASLRRVDFDDKIVLDLPEGLKTRLEDHTEPLWYCFFETGGIEASMWVGYTDFDLNDGIGSDVLATEAGRERAIRQILDDGDGIGEISRVPGGALAHDVTDDPDQGDPDESEDGTDWRNRPLRNYRWRVLRFGNGEARLAQFLLMLPRDKAEESQQQALVGLLDREIRRAQFPGFFLG